MQIIGQICAFEDPFGGLGATYDVHLRLIGKLVGGFLLVKIELFSLGAFVFSQYTQSHGKNAYITVIEVVTVEKAL